MKTKLINITTILWVLIVALNETGFLDITENDWIKAIAAIAVAIAQLLNNRVQVAKRKEAEAIAYGLKYSQSRDSIGGGGIQNPKPKKKP